MGKGQVRVSDAANPKVPIESRIEREGEVKAPQSLYTQTKVQIQCPYKGSLKRGN